MQNNRYPIVLIPAEEGGYVALIRELPGCMTQGETLEEAIAMIEDAKNQWIEVALEHGDNIPLPDIDSLIHLYIGNPESHNHKDCGFPSLDEAIKAEAIARIAEAFFGGKINSDRTQGE